MKSDKLTCSDFPLPESLILQLANAPSPIFFNSYALDALPQLNGSMSYVTSSLPLTSVSKSGGAFSAVPPMFSS